jgi:hypothetical protein
MRHGREKREAGAGAAAGVTAAAAAAAGTAVTAVAETGAKLPAKFFGATEFLKRNSIPFSMPNESSSGMNLRQFETALSRERFKGLKAILDSLSSDRQGQCDAFNSVTGYEELLRRLGYRLALIKQIHVQDAFSRMGQAGGIRAVLPYHETSTQSSFPTLVNFDATVNTTPKSAAFFNELVSALKAEGQTA